ncbi:MAG: rhomboid family intramembrane serine protease [Myxococcota bacterium]|nr:rhomboid family intramembrane serine protease [Myxococcota bacterium]
MRFAFPPLTPVARAILIVLFASFVVQSLVEGMFGIQLSEWLALHTQVGVPLAWQWATYPLVEIPGPGAVFSRGIDLLLIYAFGGYVESHLGRNRTIQLAVVSVVGGAILPLAFGLLFPTFAAPLAGGTAITWAMLGAFAVITRGAPVGFFLMPTMSAWYAVGVFLMITALQSMWTRSPMPLFMAISALVAGVLFTRWLERRPLRPKKTGPGGKRPRGASHLSVIPGGQSDDDRPRWLN